MTRLGSVVIPAHNEARVIGRTIAGLMPAVEADQIEVVVVCNGCTDDTASVVTRYPGVQLVELDTGSKILALRAGDDAASLLPRIYLDADIEVSSDSVLHVLRGLGSGSHLAGRPPFRYYLEEASTPVARYFRARSQMPSLNAALWGAGVYGLSDAGRARFGEFPDLIGDDLFVDGLFDRSEITIFDCAPAVVRIPRTARALVRILGRVYDGQEELRTGHTRSRTVRDLVAVARSGPTGATDAIVYAGFVLWAKMRRPERSWARDVTSRA